MSMIEMVVEGIGMDPHNNPLVLLRDEERKTFVPIWIGAAEAMSIQMELDNKQPPRPMTHDLISNILRELGVRLVKVTVGSGASGALTNETNRDSFSGSSSTPFHSHA